MEAPVKAFSYLRISGKGQEDGDGLTRQRIACQKFAEAHNVTLAGEFQDIQSGKDEWGERPGWSAMMSQLNGVRTILVERMDRVARRVLTQELILRDLAKREVSLLTTTGEDSSQDDPERVLFRQILASFAEFERSSIVCKLRGARQRKKDETGRCEGRKPYGFRAGELATLDRMRAMRDAGQSFGAIAAVLNSEGIPTRLRGAWIGPTVGRILSRS